MVMQDDMIINTEDKKLTIEHLYTVEDYFTFNIRIKSGDFSGVSNFGMVHFKRENWLTYY